MRNDSSCLSCGRFLDWELGRGVEHVLDYAGGGEGMCMRDCVMVNVTEGEHRSFEV